MLVEVKKYLRLSAKEKRVFWEAYLMLGIMRAAILTISFKRLTRSLKHRQSQEEITPLNYEDMKVAQAVGKGISRAASHTPWESACLVQSLTAQRMLQKRGIPGVFYLGVGKDETGKEILKAHAWSQCGEVIITGGSGHEFFTVMSVFAWGKK